MTEDYFACWFRLDQLDQYLIWIRGDPDSVLLDDRHIPVFSSEVALAQYAGSINIPIVNEEPGLVDLDAAERWLQDTDNPIDCENLLTAWNLFLDVSCALDVPFKGNRYYYKHRSPLRDTVYDKLFYGNNIYNLTPDGDYYTPVWSDRERRKIAEIIADGVGMFRRSIVLTS
ncbi:hypothetical protein [Spirosoma areae]